MSDKKEEILTGKDFQKFYGYLTKLNAIELIGVARLMGIPVMATPVVEEGKEQPKPEPRKGEDIVYDMLVKFPEMSREARRNLMKVVKAASKGKGGK